MIDVFVQVSRQQEAEGRRAAVEQLACEVKEKEEATVLRRASVESRLKDVEPAVSDAQAAVRSIKKAQLDELRVMASPPAAVKMSLEAICTLLYGVKAPSWDEIRKFIRREDFISGILEFDAKELFKDPRRLRAMRPYFDDASFNFETVNRSSKACGPLVKWMESQVMFAEVLEQVEPLRLELLQLNSDTVALSRQKEAAASELLQLQATIQSFKEAYALLISSVQTIKAEITSVTDKLHRSSQLILNLASERSRWRRQHESFAAEQLGLAGDAVICACFCVLSGSSVLACCCRGSPMLSDLELLCLHRYNHTGKSAPLTCGCNGRSRGCLPMTCASKTLVFCSVRCGRLL